MVLVFLEGYAEPCSDASDGKDCCSSKLFGCYENEGGCMEDYDCAYGLNCGKNNCPEGFPSDYNCCYKP